MSCATAPAKAKSAALPWVCLALRVGGVGCFRLAGLCAGLVSLAPCSPVAAVAAGAKPSVSGWQPRAARRPALRGPRAAELRCSGRAAMLAFLGKVKPSQQGSKAQAMYQCGFSDRAPWTCPRSTPARPPCRQRRLLRPVVSSDMLLEPSFQP